MSERTQHSPGVTVLISRQREGHQRRRKVDGA
jgi:hypothetical protein